MQKKIILLSCAFLGSLLVSPLIAGGDAVKGKMLFNDTKLGTTGKSCNTCHNNGHGLEKSGEKSEFSVMGKKYTSLEDAINFCIEKPLRGKPLDTKSPEMQDLVAYIKSLKK